jgi:hypothetical protein
MEYSRKRYSKDTNDILNSEVKSNLEPPRVITKEEIDETKCGLLSVFTKDRH